MLQRQRDEEGSALFPLACNMDFASSERYYALDYGKPQAGAMVLGFGREEGIEDFVEVLSPNTGAGIGELQLNEVTFYFTIYGKQAVPLSIGGLNCVFCQREEQLLKVIFNRKYRGQSIQSADVYGNSCLDSAVFE